MDRSLTTASLPLVTGCVGFQGATDSERTLMAGLRQQPVLLVCSHAVVCGTLPRVLQAICETLLDCGVPAPSLPPPLPTPRHLAPARIHLPPSSPSPLSPPPVPEGGRTDDVGVCPLLRKLPSSSAWLLTTLGAKNMNFRKRKTSRGHVDFACRTNKGPLISCLILCLGEEGEGNILGTENGLQFWTCECFTNSKNFSVATDSHARNL